MPVAESFVNSNIHHEAISVTVQWLDGLIADALEKAGDPLKTQSTRIFGAFGKAEVDGKALLVRTVATTLYLSDLDPNEQDKDVYVRNLGMYCLRAISPAIAEGKRQQQYANDLGAYLWSNLRDLLVNILAFQRKHERDVESFREKARQPFREV